MSKTNAGNFFEDFELGQILYHATPRTITSGDVALYTALYPTRFALQSSAEFARRSGLPEAPVDDLLTFHMVFGKTVPDISLNAVANLGYADGKFLKPVYVGDTITTTSEVIGRKENTNGNTGVVYVRSTGKNQKRETVLEYVRWVMVHKRDASSPAPTAVVPDLPGAVAASDLVVPEGLNFDSYDTALAGSPDLWGNYEVGEKIDHVDGVTVEESDHMLATRLYQNTAKVHFDQFSQANSRFGRRLIYGGVVISMVRALSFNGFANAQNILAINGGRHVAPLFGGDTVFAWTEVLDKADLPGRDDIGALRLRIIATKDHPCSDLPYKDAEGTYHPSVILDFDVWALMPR